MKIEICNLSDISRAEIDLRPLTIFIGPNNMGKTWIAYILSGIFGSRGWEEYSQAYARGQLPKSYPPVDGAIEKVLAEGNATIDLYKLAEEYGEIYFQNVADYARNWMNDYMETQLADFSNMKVSMNLADIKAVFLEQVEKHSLLLRVAGGLFTIRKEQGDKTLYAFTSIEGEEQLAEKLSIEEIKYRLVRSIFRVLHRSLYSNVRVFPTERTTLVTFPFGGRTGGKVPRPLDRNTLDTLETLEKTLQKIQNLSGLAPSTIIERNARATIGPVANFLGMMSAVFRIGSQQMEERKAKAKDDPRIQKYIDLAEILEKQILSGGLAFSTPEPDPRRDILFQATQDVTLEIPIVSSMIKELAPLVFYLRYLAEPGELLIIDEPEMNLHPAAQTQIIEFLAMLVNAELHVLITTHSTYVIDHLTNLMDAYKHKNQDEIAEMFLLEQKEAFISQEKVSVYLVEDGEVKNVLDPEGIIHWKTFSDVTKYVERIHFELLGA
jgi:hypothetical protein